MVDYIKDILRLLIVLIVCLLSKKLSGQEKVVLSALSSLLLCDTGKLIRGHLCLTCHLAYESDNKFTLTDEPYC